MNVSRVTLTDEQKVAVVDRAIALMRDGSTQNAASRQAASEFGISDVSVRRYATKQGRPLSAVTDDEAKKRTERAATLHKTYGLAEQRGIAMILVEAIKNRAETLLEQSAAKDAPPDLDLRLQRSVVALREATELEHALYLRGAGPGDGKDADQPGEEPVERPENVRDIDESRRLMEQMEQEARGG